MVLCAVTHQSSLWFDERSVDAVHLVVQTAGVTQVVSSTVPPPQGCRHGPTVHTFSTLGEVIEEICVEKKSYRSSSYLMFILSDFPATA